MTDQVVSSTTAVAEASERHRATYYQVSDLWRAVDWPVPATDDEARKGALRLYKRFVGRPFSGNIRMTSGRRGTRIIGTEMRLNRNRLDGQGGWAAIVHDLSHTIHFRVNRGRVPHDPWHRELERSMASYVIEHKWHLGALAPRPRATASRPQVDKRTASIARLEARLSAWESKARRAETAIAKIRRSLAAYERANKRKVRSDD